MAFPRWDLEDRIKGLLRAWSCPPEFFRLLCLVLRSREAGELPSSGFQLRVAEPTAALQVSLWWASLSCLCRARCQNPNSTWKHEDYCLEEMWHWFASICGVLLLRELMEIWILTSFFTYCPLPFKPFISASGTVWRKSRHTNRLVIAIIWRKSRIGLAIFKLGFWYLALGQSQPYSGCVSVLGQD